MPATAQRPVADGSGTAGRDPSWPATAPRRDRSRRPLRPRPANPCRDRGRPRRAAAERQPAADRRADRRPCGRLRAIAVDPLPRAGGAVRGHGGRGARPPGPGLPAGRPEPPPARPRIDAFCRQRAAMLEAGRPVRPRLALREPFSPALRDYRRRHVQRVLDEVRVLFRAELSACAASRTADGAGGRYRRRRHLGLLGDPARRPRPEQSAQPRRDGAHRARPAGRPRPSDPDCASRTHHPRRSPRSTMSLNLAYILRESAKADPAKPALLFDGGRISYGRAGRPERPVRPRAARRPDSRPATGSACSCRTCRSSSSPTSASSRPAASSCR